MTESYRNVTPSTTETSSHNGVPSATNEDRLQEIRARLDAATRGLPDWYEDAISDTLSRSSMAWVYSEGGGRPVAAVPEKEDRDLIAHAPADIAWLLDEVERLTKRVRMYEVVKS